MKNSVKMRAKEAELWVNTWSPGPGELWYRFWDKRLHDKKPEYFHGGARFGPFENSKKAVLWLDGFLAGMRREKGQSAI